MAININTSGRITQDVDDDLDYSLDCSDWLAEGDTIATAQFLVNSPAGLTAHTVTKDDTSITWWLKAGVAGRTYDCTLRFTTSDGRKKDVDVVVEIRD